MSYSGYFEFGCRVRICSGPGSLERIPQALAALNAHRPMIITDAGVSGAGLLDIVTKAIENGITIGAVADTVPPDSDLRVVNRLAAEYREKGCDALVAVGGGSVLDTAKGVNIVVSENADDLMRFSGSGAIRRRLNPLVAVPTTAGTGSEVTQAAVIADHARNRKMLFVSYFLLPDLAVLDPRMTLTLPPAITAATAMDALSHAVEAYTCLAKNPLSDRFTVSAIRLIRDHLLDVVARPDDAPGRLALANAATLAGIAFSNASVGMVHAMGHSVGAVCGVPHGTCMAIGLPYGLEYNLHRNGHLTAELLLPLAGEAVVEKTRPEDRAERVIAEIRGLNEALHQATDGRHARWFAEVRDRQGRPAVPREAIPRIAETAIGDGTIFYNPEALDYDDFLMVLEAAWNGTPLDRSKINKGGGRNRPI